MFNTVEEVSKNKYINNLTNEVSMHNMFGAYINYVNAESPQYNGIYFICGYDSEKIMDKNANIEKLFKEQMRQKTYNLEYSIHKITDQSPFNVHQSVLNYALHASTMRAIFNKYKYYGHPQVVSSSYITYCEMLYLNANDTSLTVEARMKNEMMLKKLLFEEGQREKECNGLTDGGPKLHLRPEEIKKNSPPNMVTMEELNHYAGHVRSLVTTIENADLIQKEFSKHKKIRFFRAKPVYSKLKVPDNEGFGSKELNEGSSVTFLYDGDYEKEAQLIHFKVHAPEVFEYSIDDIKKRDNTTVSFGVSALDIKNLFATAKQLGIPMCLDVKKLYFSTDKNFNPESNIAGYTVTIAKSDSQAVDRMLTMLAVRARDRRFLTQNDLKKYSYNTNNLVSQSNTRPNHEDDAR